MLLACSTRGLDLYPDRYGHFTPASRVRLFAWALQTGFSAIEMEDRWADPDLLSEGELLDLRAAAEEIGVALTLKLHFRDLHTPEVAEASEESVRRAIHAADVVGAPLVSLTLSTPPDALAAASRRLGRAWDGSGSGLPEEAFERTAAALRRLADLAVDLDIELSIELHQGSLVDSSSRLLRLLDLVDYANVGANPDIANVLQAPSPEETWREAIEALAPRANYWHVKNLRRIEIPNGKPYLLRRALHEGEIDYRWAVAVMCDAGFDGIVVVEGPGSGDHLRAVEESRAYLASLLAELDGYDDEEE
jgi:sugar phosphate isomerase/epimerase